MTAPTVRRAELSESTTAVASRKFLELVLRVGCTPHDALSGEYCWRGDSRGVCGARIIRAGEAVGARQTKTRVRRPRS
jgi:hypothetical protein